MKTLPLNELFDVSYGNKFDLNKMTVAEGGISFVGRAEANHGVSARVAPVTGVAPFSAGLITVALGGSRLLCSFVQEAPFYTAQNVAVLQAKTEMSFAQKLYICMCIRANRFKYSAFGREANRSLRTLHVPRMEDFPGWTRTAVANPAGAPDACALSKHPMNIDASTWNTFELGRLFDIRKGARLTKADQRPGSTPYIGAIDRNNGVSAYIEQPPNHQGGTITVNYNGSVGEAFYQPKPFWASDDVNVLYSKTHPITPAIGVFLSAVIRAEKYRYSYGRKWGLERMVSSTIKLPVRLDSGQPDWQWMEDFIRTRPYSAALGAFHTPLPPSPTQ